MFGSYLRWRRNRAGVSIQTLSKRSRVSAAVISRIENGKADPRLTTIHCIAKRGFKQNIVEFLQGYIDAEQDKVVWMEPPKVEVLES